MEIRFDPRGEEVYAFICGEVDHHNIVPVSEHRPCQPGKDAAHEVMELQRQFRQDDKYTPYDIYCNLFHFYIILVPLGLKSQI